VAAGTISGLGVAIAVAGAFPSRRVDPIDVLERLDPERAQVRRRAQPTAPRATAGLEKMFGSQLLNTVASSALVKLPASDLALLGVPTETYIAQRLASGLLGLLIPPLLTAVAAVAGLAIPFAIPVVASLAVGLVLFISSDQDVRRRADAGRREFRQVLQRYMELVALERAADAGPVQALEEAASVGDSWVFSRIKDALVRAQLNGVAPWDGLHQIADDIGVPALGELADMMRAAGEEGGAIYNRLLARSDSLRNEIQTDEQAAAEEGSERMIVPMSLLAVLFVVIIAYPMAMRIK
jgi:hypothetical protein